MLADAEEKPYICMKLKRETMNSTKKYFNNHMKSKTKSNLFHPNYSTTNCLTNLKNEMVKTIIN